MANTLNSLIRMHEWNVDEKRRKLGQLLGLMEDINRQLVHLAERLVEEQKIAAEQPELAGFHYDNFAKSVMERRERLEDTQKKMELVITEARKELNVAYQELKKFEKAEANRLERVNKEIARRDQLIMDEIGLQNFARQQTN